MSLARFCRIQSRAAYLSRAARSRFALPGVGRVSSIASVVRTTRCPTAAAYRHSVSSVGFLLCPVSSHREGRLVDPATPGHLGQGESRRLAGVLEFFHERAQLAILAVEVEVRPLAAGDQLFGEGCQSRNLSRRAWWRTGLRRSTRPWDAPCLLSYCWRSSFRPQPDSFRLRRAGGGPACIVASRGLRIATKRSQRFAPAWS